ncbi:MAG TPA: hypothetical protein VGN37_10635 [Actinocatenispora sp.]
MTTPPPVLDAPTASKARRAKRPIRRTPGTVLGFLALGAAAVVVVVGLTVGIYIYQDAYRTAHQTSPSQAADGFLDATLNDHRLDLAENYMCDGDALERQIGSMIQRIKSAQTEHPNAQIKYTWSGFRQVSRRDARARLTTDVTVSTIIGSAVSTNPAQTWTFAMRNVGGWKVCGLRVPE